MKTFKITYEFISHDKEGIAYEQMPANSCEEALMRFNSRGTFDIKVLEIKEM